MVYTPGEIVRFMIDGADWLCEQHFGTSLIERDVEILAPMAARRHGFGAEAILRGRPVGLPLPPMRRPRALIACLLLGAALPAVAQQEARDIEVLTRWAGTWAVDCAKPAGTRLTVDTRALTLRAGKGERRTGAPITAYSWFGQMQPPAGFEVALLGDAKPGGLAFLAMQDEAGPYLRVDGDPTLEQQFGKAALAGKFRRCP